MEATMGTQQQGHEAAMLNLYSQQSMGMYSMAPQYAAQPPTLYSNGPSVLTPAGSPKPMSAQKPAILLDTDFDNTYYPSTPPLSTSGSTVGSPKNFDGLQTPMNPMFSGLDESENVKETLEPVETTVLDWSSNGSPITPIYLQAQLAQASFSSATSDPFSTASCPSLSPSPAPYARSVTSDQGVDFCDPRNLVVSAGSVNSTLAPEASVNTCGDHDVRRLHPRPIALVAQPAFNFNPDLPDGLPSFEELSDLESEEDFVNSIVSFPGHEDATEIGRPRAGTGSSVVSLGHGSFIDEEDFGFDTIDGLAFNTLPSPLSTTASFCEETHRDKRVKKSHKKEARVVSPHMNMSATDAQADHSHEMSPDHDDNSASDSGATSGSEDPDAPLPAPTNRRGRKQSLTEDPSKTFVCDLCNRRFRRQEHLKRHYRSLHTQEKPFECNECGKKFSRSDNLAQHARTHGSGAIVMNLLEDGELPFDGAAGAHMTGAEDYSAYGKVLFQMAAEIPGSGSDVSSEDGGDDGNKKRKRSD